MSVITKQDHLVGDAPCPQEPVLPRLHPTTEIKMAIERENLRDDAILQSLAYLATESDWQGVWRIADALKREVSLLFDDQGLIWVDVGDSGMVRLSPPNGSRLPLRLWVHTHPWDAYWSATDQRTLATVTGILEQALVLGHDHLVRTVHCAEMPTSSSASRLSNSGTLMHWTAESKISYRMEDC